MIGKDEVLVSHLQFTDDTIFFHFGDEEKFTILLKVVDLFCAVSRLRVLNKEIFFWC